MAKKTEHRLETEFEAVLPKVEEHREGIKFAIFVCLVYWITAMVTVWYLVRLLKSPFDTLEELERALRLCIYAWTASSAVALGSVLTVLCRRHTSSAAVFVAVLEALLCLVCFPLLGGWTSFAWNGGHIVVFRWMYPFFTAALGIGAVLLIVKTGYVMLSPAGGRRTN